MHILVTGAAGFIGYHLSERFLARGDTVVGLDNLNDYYSVSLKEARLERLQRHNNFLFLKADLEDRAALDSAFHTHRFDAVVNLAAQAGVRYSLENPRAYIDSNIVGFGNLLECCREQRTGHLVYASSSSVYGMNSSMPFSVHDNVDHPISLYAASKKANELMAHTYSHLFQIPTTGLRFFTVYGPWGRRDWAFFLFSRALRADEPIAVFNEGKMLRDFTYIDDIVEGVVRVTDQPATANPRWNPATRTPAAAVHPIVYTISVTIHRYA
ncbi:MAG: SDR family NAD(P)-dependent oxidoreductase [Halioglobus sp.]